MSKDSYSPNKRVRESQQDGSVVKEFMTTPKVGETDKTEIKARRPMPGVIILVHGVNDVGEAYATQADGLCAGLNYRLGREDLVPGDWDIPKACGENRVATYERRAAAQGNNPIIPFYWGYRAVDEATCRADQARYRDELRRRGKEADPPYDAYYVEGRDNPKMGYENTDCYGNRLNENFAKNGGVFANATSNLVDMWGPGGQLWPLIKGASKIGDDLSHPMYTNPHRIYYVHAAQRLANLISEIRDDPAATDDSITIIAHSQGTSVSILANFLVASGDNPRRPADCLILNNSPYSIEEPIMESVQVSGPQQTAKARIETLKKFCEIFSNYARSGPTSKELGEKGVVSSHVEAEPKYMRDNHGKIFNYFTPHDKVVSLYNVQGLGWQGLPPQITDQLQPVLTQRIFLDGKPLAEPPGRIQLPDFTRNIYEWFKNRGFVELAKNTDIPDEQRDINAPELPNLGYVFHTQEGCDLLTPSNWGVQAAGMADEGENLVSDWIENPLGSGRQRGMADYGRIYLNNAEVAQLEAELNKLGKPWRVHSGEYSSHDPRTFAYVRNRAYIHFKRYRMPEELREAALDTHSEISNHSAIVLDREASACVTAFDVAVGRCKSFDVNKKDGGEFWQRLLRMADWRYSQEEDDVVYRSTGILPAEIKVQMNDPPFIFGIENEVIQYGTKYVVETKRAGRETFRVVLAP